MLEDFIDVSEVLQGGVYALLCKGTVVYIGKTELFAQRLYLHQNNSFRKRGPKLVHSKIVYGNQPIPFDSVIVKPCESPERDELEVALIEHYRPRFNILLKPSVTRAFSQKYIESGILARIIAGEKLPKVPSPYDPPHRHLTLNRRGL